MDPIHALELLAAAAAGMGMGLWLRRSRPAPAGRADEAGDKPEVGAESAFPRLAGRAEVVEEIARRAQACSPERPLLVATFELDDFHSYTDLYGRTAGDALLSRLGTALVQAIGGRGNVLRTGPVEFSAILPLEDEGPGRVLSMAAAALFAGGQGFSVGCSHGAATMPADTTDPSRALALADERRGADRAARRKRGERAGDALAAALRDRDARRVQQRRALADLAEDTARKLGVPETETETIRIAAGLHDVGKMAIPEEILEKAGPLDDDEWGFVRCHTAIGERIVAAAPDLGEAAAIVRSIPERWDGRGYPDGLSRTRIPLGARIVAVCSAYDAMITTRPYRRALPVQEALAELRRFAGVQFDPDVVEAFCLALLDQPVERS